MVFHPLTILTRLLRGQILELYQVQIEVDRMHSHLNLVKTQYRLMRSYNYGK